MSAFENLSAQEKVLIAKEMDKRQGGILGGGGLSDNVINLALIMGGLRALGPQPAGQNLASNIAQGVSEGIQLGAALQPKPPLIPPGETKREEELGRKSVEEEIKFNQSMVDNENTIKVYDELIQAFEAVDDKDVGFLGEQRLTFDKVKKLAGLPVDEEIAPRELIRRLSGQLVLDGLKNFKGAISDKEREFLQDMMAGLNTTKEGAIRLLQIGKKKAQIELLKREGKNLYQSKQANILVPLELETRTGEKKLYDFNTFLDEYAAEKGKIFTNEISQIIDQSKQELDTENKNRYKREIIDDKVFYFYTAPNGEEIKNLSLTEQEYKDKFGGL